MEKRDPMPFSPEDNMLEVQRSLGRIEGNIESLRGEIKTQIEAIDQRLSDHIRDEEEFRAGVERKAMAKSGNRATLVAGMLSSGLITWIITWWMNKK